MHTSAFLAALAGAASAKSIIRPAQQHIFTNPDAHDEGYRIPTVRESTAMARKIMHLTTIGNLVTTFPTPNDNDVGLTESRPDEVAGSPIGLMEYYADCDPLSGNPIMLGINIATPFRNYAAGSNISLSVRWWPDRKKTFSLFADDDEDIPTPHTPAALPRFSLHGHLESLSEEQVDAGRIKECFLRSHPDSIYWQPGNDVHTSHYVQLIVEHVYWFGGFGDRARIGWLPISEWRNLTMKEIIKAKLPGEKHAKRWWKSDLL